MNPRYTCSYQGVSAGWADVYNSGLACQFVVIDGASRTSCTSEIDDQRPASAPRGHVRRQHDLDVSRIAGDTVFEINLRPRLHDFVEVVRILFGVAMVAASSRTVGPDPDRPMGPEIRGTDVLGRSRESRRGDRDLELASRDGHRGREPTPQPRGSDRDAGVPRLRGRRRVLPWQNPATRLRCASSRGRGSADGGAWSYRRSESSISRAGALFMSSPLHDKAPPSLLSRRLRVDAHPATSRRDDRTPFHCGIRRLPLVPGLQSCGAFGGVRKPSDRRDWTGPSSTGRVRNGE